MYCTTKVMIYKSMLTQNNLESYIKHLKKEEEGEEYCEKLIKDFLTLSKKLEIKISDGMKREEIKDNGTVDTFVQYKITISRKYRNKAIKTSFEFVIPLESEDQAINLARPDLSDVLLDVRLSMSAAPSSFKEYCEMTRKNPRDPNSKIKYRNTPQTA